jgi:hypothetical protein
MKMKMDSWNLKTKDLSKRREVLAQQFSFTVQATDTFSNTAVITTNLAHMPKPTKRPNLDLSAPHTAVIHSTHFQYCHHIYA